MDWPLGVFSVGCKNFDGGFGFSKSGTSKADSGKQGGSSPYNMSSLEGRNAKELFGQVPKMQCNGRYCSSRPHRWLQASNGSGTLALTVTPTTAPSELAYAWTSACVFNGVQALARASVLNCASLLQNMSSARKFILPVGENSVLPIVVMPKCQVHVLQFLEHLGKPKISLKVDCVAKQHVLMAPDSVVQ